MDERSQGAMEYLVLLATALVILATTIYVTLVAMDDFGDTVENNINEIKENAIGGLT